MACPSVLTVATAAGSETDLQGKVRPGVPALGAGDAALAIGIAAIIYVIADVLNKVGFGIIAVRAAKQS